MLYALFEMRFHLLLSPHSPMRELSPDSMEVRYRGYMKDFERHNLPTFAGGSDVMIADDWL